MCHSGVGAQLSYTHTHAHTFEVLLLCHTHSLTPLKKHAGKYYSHVSVYRVEAISNELSQCDLKCSRACSIKGNIDIPENIQTCETNN